jgi:hypothetical protein
MLMFRYMTTASPFAAKSGLSESRAVAISSFLNVNMDRSSGRFNRSSCHPAEHVFLRGDRAQLDVRNSMNANDNEGNVTFHPDIQVMEVDFSNLTFEVPGMVHAAYDQIEKKLENTGKKWLFLVNYENCQIMSQAWIAFAYRGKRVNLAYSLGSARFAAPGDASDAILERARQKQFDPNLFSSREAALEHLAGVLSEIPVDDYEAMLVPTPPSDTRTAADRVIFHPKQQIMEIDCSAHTFATSADVNAFYDELAKQISDTGKKWYFMINYENTEILPDAWYAWASRGKELNVASSLGSVRFNPQEETKEEILKRARTEDFNPNIVSTRDEALARIDELKQS